MSEIKNRDLDLICRTYTRYPLEIVSGSGTRLFDRDGKEYLDMLAGIAVCNLGHCPPEINAVIREQAEKLVHLSNLFYQSPQLDLADRLLGTCEASKVFFCNSGAEANEAAIKLARRYMRRVQNTDAQEIISLEGSFHGRTLATLTATGQSKGKEDFAPLPQGFKVLPPNSVGALEKNLTSQTAALLMEVIQGEGGVIPLDEQYLKEAQKLCRDRGVLLILDEVQCGMGRTGEMWAHQNLGLRPDIFTAAKALANGLPMGAMLASEEVSRGFEPGVHAATFGGGPLVSAVADKVLQIMQREDICAQVREKGAYAQNALGNLKNKFPDQIQEIRGAGLMLGIEFYNTAKDVWTSLLDKGYICNLIQDKILRILPPLVIENKDIESFVRALEEILQQR